jgi:hypothetical protein
VFLSCSVLAGCVVYEPVPAYYPAPSTFDRAFNAALGATQDAGVIVTSSDPTTGVIRGTKDGIDVSVSVVREPGGGSRVQLDTRGPSERDPGLHGRFTQAYERRMGR